MSFMKLPGELRNKIYDWAVFPEHSFVQVTHCTHEKDIVSKIFCSPLFRTSKAIREEAMSRILGTKTINVTGLHSISAFVNYVGTIGEANITSFRFLEAYDFDLIDEFAIDSKTTRSLHPVAQALRRFPRLTNLEIVLHYTYDEFDPARDMFDNIEEEFTAQGVKVKLLRIGNDGEIIERVLLD